MGIQSGSLHGGFAARPLMELDFTVQIWRATITQTAIGSSSRVFAKHGSPVACQVDVMQDEIYFLQSGETERIVANLHFYENTDVQKDDIVQVLSNRRLGDATTGTYYAIEGTVSPAAETYGYIRARATIGKEPTSVT